MKAIENDTILFRSVQPKLAAHDDRELRRVALSVLADEFAQHYPEESGLGVWAMVVGACSHWVGRTIADGTPEAGLFIPLATKIRFRS